MPKALKEKSVVLSPMVGEARYEFENCNYSSIAETILTELRGMKLFRNYYTQYRRHHGLFGKLK
ncbi:hypothetical protein IPdc08_00030 [archaeon]|nr:hypothetical protein IPdc08_00030 [archaeon]